jgi:hypothetical protein
MKYRPPPTVSRELHARRRSARGLVSRYAGATPRPRLLTGLHNAAAVEDLLEVPRRCTRPRRLAARLRRRRRRVHAGCTPSRTLPLPAPVEFLQLLDRRPKASGALAAGSSRS